ncbi:restriction endonuclease subunit S [Brevundimonas mediterranea]|jgi:type I restriction enzyme, S subunit|nr:restriction endonuclease subunit S [Brevundimonas mediterranea]
MQGGIRPGYKQSEVGVIPEDWEVRSLGVLSEFITKGSTPTTYGFDWVQSGVLFLRSECVSEDGLDLEKSMFISETAHRTLRRSEVKDGDILVTITGNVGRIVRLSGIGAANLNQHIARVRIVAREADEEFLFHYLRQPEIRVFYNSITTGQAYPQLSLVQVRDTNVPLPSLPEQRGIAEALSDADTLIAALEGMIAKKRDLKQAAMQHLLTGKTRLPGFSGEWEVKRLGELCAMRSGEGITAKSIDESSAYPCYGGNGLRGYTTRFTHQGRYALIGRVGALCGNILLADGKFFASEHAIVVTALDRVDIGWLAVILDTLGLNRRAESSAQPVLTVSKLLILEVLAPPTKAEQTAIAEALSDMDADLAALEAQAAKARAVKQGMMQELLTGRVRLV